MKLLGALLESQPFIALFLTIGLCYGSAIATRAHDFYPGGRHEMFHELNRCEIVTNLLVWISGVLERASR
jgi:hypothetical protein